MPVLAETCFVTDGLSTLTCVLFLEGAADILAGILVVVVVIVADFATAFTEVFEIELLCVLGVLTAVVELAFGGAATTLSAGDTVLEFAGVLAPNAVLNPIDNKTQRAVR